MSQTYVIRLSFVAVSWQSWHTIAPDQHLEKLMKSTFNVSFWEASNGI
ncbi:hypothetical protein TFUB22_00324 [Tannerella forsythia]|nr:hypothetical protein TFUB22_00324 [Tannerella forsythia]